MMSRLEQMRLQEVERKVASLRADIEAMVREELARELARLYPLEPATEWPEPRPTLKLPEKARGKTNAG